MSILLLFGTLFVTVVVYLVVTNADKILDWLDKMGDPFDRG